MHCVQRRSEWRVLRTNAKTAWVAAILTAKITCIPPPSRRRVTIEHTNRNPQRRETSLPASRPAKTAYEAVCQQLTGATRQKFPQQYEILVTWVHHASSTNEMVYQSSTWRIYQAGVTTQGSSPRRHSRQASKRREGKKTTQNLEERQSLLCIH